MRLVLARAAAARTLLGAAALAAFVTCVLITAFLLYAYLLPTAGTRAAVAAADPHERTVLVTSDAGREPGAIAARDAAVRELLADTLGDLSARVYAAGYGSSLRLPDDHPGVDPGVHGAYAVVAFLPELSEVVDLVAGRWPEPVDAGEPAEAVVPASAAAALELAVGDEVDVVFEILGEPRPMRIVGVFEPRDPSAEYWQLASTPLSRNGYGPFVVHPDEFAARYQLLASLEWLVVPEPGDLVGVGMGTVTQRVERLLSELDMRREADPALGGATRVSTGLADLADGLSAATVVYRSSLVMPAALLTVIAIYGLVLVAQLLSEHRRTENALLRARGASRAQLLRFTGAEALLAVGPAALLAAPVGTWLVRVVDGAAGDRSLGIADDLAAAGWVGPPGAWLVALSAAAACGLALALPTARRGRTWVAEQQQRSRPSRAAAWQRAGVDVALVVGAAIAWWQLQQYGATVGPRGVGDLQIDPLLVAAPVVSVLAATTVALRLLPLATRLGVWLAGRRDSFPSLLGMWQADRRPHAGPVLLLVLAVATAVLAPTVAGTWQQSQRDQAGHAVGTDLRLVSSDLRTTPAVREVVSRPEVSAVMAVHRRMVEIENVGRVPLLALESTGAAEAVVVRGDLVHGDVADTFALLHEGRPEPVTAPLPEGAQRLVGTVVFESPPDAVLTAVEEINGEMFSITVEVESPVSFRPAVYVMTSGGTVVEVGLPTPLSGTPVKVDVPLPPDAAAVAGLRAGMITSEFPAFFFEDQLEMVDHDVSWRFDLSVVAADGTVHPLTLPEEWRLVAHGPQGELASPPHRLAVDIGGDVTARVTATVDYLDYVARSTAYLITDPAPVPPPTALVSPGLAAALDLAMDGSVVELGGIPVRPVGSLAAVPGVADGEAVVVDLGWLTHHQVRGFGTPSPATEWWLATAEPAALREHLAALPVQYEDRQLETDRLLGDPLGNGVLLALWAAAGAGALLAAFGLLVDSRSNAVRRRQELAVLHTLGVAPGALARALVVEQVVLAGLGVVAGVAVGLGVAVATGPSLVLTPAGTAPVPPVLLVVTPELVAAPAVGLLLAAVVLGAVVARRARREVRAGALRIGEE